MAITAAAAALGAAGSLGSTALNWAASNQLADKNFDYNKQLMQMGNEFNAQQAQLQRDFEERMSSSALQRSMADAKAAGINPAAIGNGINAASTPSGAVGTSAQGHAGSPVFNGAGDYGSTLLGMIRSMAIDARSKAYQQLVDEKSKQFKLKFAENLKSTAKEVQEVYDAEGNLIREIHKSNWKNPGDKLAELLN